MSRRLAGAASQPGLDNGAAVSETHSAVVFFAGEQTWRPTRPYMLPG
jgi:hypothetical protein